MNREDIMIDVWQKPRKINRTNSDFVDSVNHEFRKCMSGGLLVTTSDVRDLFFLATVKGVYLDADLGNIEVIGYLANNVLYQEGWYDVPDHDFMVDGVSVVKDAEDLRKVSDKALFIAACMPDVNKREGLRKWEYTSIGRRGYSALSSLDGAVLGNFRELAVNFEDYVNAIEHTSHEYLWQNAA